MFEKLLDVLVYQRDNRIDGSVYKSCQCDFAYNSNRIEGSTLSHGQTVRIFDRDSFSGTAPVDDIVEARNHFEAFDCILDTASSRPGHQMPDCRRWPSGPSSDSRTSSAAR